jgi:hypothetical protein
MSDITMCSGTNCPKKEECYRFTAYVNEYRQSWFCEPPFKIVEDKFTCEMFWGDANEGILNQLKDIMNGKGNN